MSSENMVSSPEQTTKAYIDGVIDKNDSNVLSTTGRLVNVSVYDSLGYSYIAQFAINANYTDKTTKNYYQDASGNNTLSPTAADGTANTKVNPATATAVQVYIDNKTGNETLSATDADGTANKKAQTPIEGSYSIKCNKLIDSEGKNVLDDGATMTLSGTALEFNTATGAIKTPTTNEDKEANLNLTIGGIDAFTTPISVNFANLKMYDNNGTSTVAGHYGDTSGNFAGRKKGAISGVAIQQDGKIFGSYDNGTTKLLGQIAVTSFANPSGLEKIGDNLYDTTQNSGAFDGIGKDITADGGGSMKTGVLEMSNVDLSSEFTEMITTQRGFQANSRIITVSDTMLEELINLKR